MEACEKLGRLSTCGVEVDCRILCLALLVRLLNSPVLVFFLTANNKAAMSWCWSWCIRERVDEVENDYGQLYQGQD